jgi:hypothetical protein
VVLVIRARGRNNVATSQGRGGEWAWERGNVGTVGAGAGLLCADLTSGAGPGWYGGCWRWRGGGARQSNVRCGARTLPSYFYGEDGDVVGGVEGAFLVVEVLFEGVDEHGGGLFDPLQEVLGEDGLVRVGVRGSRRVSSIPSV